MENLGLFIGALGAAGERLLSGISSLLRPSSSFSAEALQAAASAPIAEGQVLTVAGRAVTKHPSYFGAPTNQELRQMFRSDHELNALAAGRISQSLQTGAMTTGGAGSNAWVTYTLPNGLAASWNSSTGRFLGFRGPRP